MIFHWKNQKNQILKIKKIHNNYAFNYFIDIY